jgi:hypothetical protein
MGVYVNLKPCVGVCSSFGILIMVYGILILKPLLWFCKKIGISIMRRSRYMGVYVNLKPCIGVYLSLGIPIMVHFNVMGGILI